MKFQVGDTVRRIEDQWCGMRIGDIGTVIAVNSVGDIAIKEYGGNDYWHSARCFELVKKQQKIIKKLGIANFMDSLDKRK
jgi:hypothetical protein